MRRTPRRLLVTVTALSLALTPLAMPAAADPPQGSGVSTAALVLHLPFDESEGSIAFDASGLGHHSTLYRGATFEPESGALAGAVRFDGVKSYVHVPDATELNMGTVTARTISLWFKAEDPGVTERKQILWEEGGTSKGLSLYLHDGRLYAGGWNGATGIKWKGTFLSTDAITANQWHHAALTLDGGPGIAPDTLWGYLDGIPFESGPGAQVDGHGGIGIGRANGAPKFHDGVFSGDHGLAGHVDDVRVYNRVLTAEEVGSLAAGGGSEPPENRAPIADAGSDRTVAPGATVELDGSASTDPDAGPQPLTYAWEQVSGPPVTIEDASSSVASVTLELVDTYVFRLTVDDGDLTDADEVTIETGIVPNVAPIAHAGSDRTVAPGATVELDGSASTDPDAGPQPLTYAWEQVSGPPVTIQDASSSVASVTLELVDTYVFRLTVDDGDLTDADEVTIQALASQPGVAGEVPLTDVSGLTSTAGEWDPNNQRRSWWNSSQGRWDAVLPLAAPPAAGPSHWWIVKGADEAAPLYAVEVNTSSGTRPDVFWDESAGLLFVLEARASKTTFKRYRYDAATDTYSLEVGGVRVPGTDASHRATIYRSPNGHLWTSMMISGSSGGLWVNRSTDGGVTWGQPVRLLIPQAQGQTSLVHLGQGGSSRIAVAAAEDGKAADSRFLFLTLDQDDPAWDSPSAWSDESGLIPPFEGEEHADDEISVVRDAIGNVFIAAETEPGPTTGSGDPQLVLYRRSTAGEWTQVAITRYVKGARTRKRPTVVVDGDADTVYVFTVNLNKRDISYVAAPLGNIDLLAEAPLTTVFEAEGKQFRNNVTPRFATDGASGILVLVDNLTDATIWQRRLPSVGGG